MLLVLLFLLISYILESTEEQTEVESLKPLQEPAQLKENDVNLDDSLRAFYQNPSKATISLLILQDDMSRQMSIKDFYTDLAIIGDEEREAKREELKDGIQKSDAEDGRAARHESIFEPRQPISLQELFKYKKLENASEKKVVILGDAGIGKSTLCQYIAYMWASKELFQEFEYVFWLPLRSLNETHYAKDPSLANYLAQECRVSKEVIQAYLDNRDLRPKTLILLDGYDELSKEAANEDGTLHHVLKELKEFPNIIITSRPGPIPQFKSVCKLEILGFDSKSIEKYIERFFTADKEKAKILKDRLKYPLFKSLAHNPINLEIFCSLTAAGEELSSTSSPTMTSIYTNLTHWLFTRFRHKQFGPHVLEEPDARNAPDVKLLAETLEDIAWESMNQDTIYIQMAEITKIYRAIDPNIDPQSIRSVGPLRIEKGEGVFMHLTFQEYFAAAWLARLYAINPEKAKGHVRALKFEPRYKLVLHMTAGILSKQEKVQNLQKFFDDLFSEPYDLSKHYELELFARCFQECENRQKIKQHARFIQNVANYIQDNSIEDCTVGLLYKNSTLLNDPQVVNVIIEQLKDDEKTEEALNIIYRLASHQEPIPAEIFKFLLSMCSSIKPKDHINYNAMATIAQIARNGGDLNSQALKMLIKIMKDKSLPAYDRKMAIHALRVIVEGGEIAVESQVSAELISIIRTKSLDYFTQGEGVSALQAIVEKKGSLDANLSATLIDIFLHSSLDPFVLGKIATIFEIDAKAGREVNPVVLATLIKMVNDESEDLDESARGKAASALLGITAQGGEAGSQASAALTRIVKSDSSQRSPAVLGAIAASESELSSQALVVLISMIKSAGEKYNPRTRAIISAFKVVAESKGGLGIEATTVLTHMIKDKSLGSWLRGDIAAVFRVVVEKGKNLSAEAIELFVDMLKDKWLDYYARAEVAATLGTIAEKGVDLGPNVSQALIGMAKDYNVNLVQEKVMFALGAIAKSGENLTSEDLLFLIDMAKNETMGDFVRGKAVSAIAAIARGQGSSSPQASEALNDLLKNDKLTKIISRYVAKGLTTDHLLTYSKKSLNNAVDACNIIGCACFHSERTLYQVDKQRKIAVRELSYLDQFNLVKLTQNVKQRRD